MIKYSVQEEKNQEFFYELVLDWGYLGIFQYNIIREHNLGNLFESVI